MLGLFCNAGENARYEKITGQHLHPYIKNGDVEWGNINIDNLDEMDFEDDEIERYSVLPDDLMICEGEKSENVRLFQIFFQRGFIIKRHCIVFGKEKKIAEMLIFYIMLYFAWQRMIVLELLLKKQLLHICREML